MANPVKTNVWSFVEKFYPNYSSCEDIAYNNDLSLIVNDEEEQESHAFNLLNDEFNGDREQALISLVASNEQIYAKAINAFIEQHPELLKSI